MSHCIKTVQFYEFLGGVELACHAEYNGSQLYNYIELVVEKLKRNLVIIQIFDVSA